LGVLFVVGVGVVMSQLKQRFSKTELRGVYICEDDAVPVEHPGIGQFSNQDNKGGRAGKFFLRLSVVAGGKRSVTKIGEYATLDDALRDTDRVRATYEPRSYQKGSSSSSSSSSQVDELPVASGPVANEAARVQSAFPLGCHTPVSSRQSSSSLARPKTIEAHRNAAHKRAASTEATNSALQPLGDNNANIAGVKEKKTKKKKQGRGISKSSGFSRNTCDARAAQSHDEEAEYEKVLTVAARRSEESLEYREAQIERLSGCLSGSTPEQLLVGWSDDPEVSASFTDGQKKKACTQAHLLHAYLVKINKDHLSVGGERLDADQCAKAAVAQSVWCNQVCFSTIQDWSRDYAANDFHFTPDGRGSYERNTLTSYIVDNQDVVGPLKRWAKMNLRGMTVARFQTYLVTDVLPAISADDKAKYKIPASVPSLASTHALMCDERVSDDCFYTYSRTLTGRHVVSAPLQVLLR
jgi:hypothetical protein